MERLLFVGNSHLVAILHAAREASGESPTTAETTFLWSSEEVHTYRVSIDRAAGAAELSFALLDGASWSGFTSGGGAHPTVTPSYADVLRSLVPDGVDQVVSCLYGSDHSAFSLVEHRVPFDFVLDEMEVDEQADGTRQIVPAAVVRRELTARLTPLVCGCRALHQLFPEAALTYVLPPPPLADSELIRGRPEALDVIIATRGVAPGPLRLKAYRLAAQIVQEELAGSGIQILPAPSTALDAGYLSEACWMGSVHANSTYGGLVLDQLGVR
jgi:hypothetical protein